MTLEPLTARPRPPRSGAPARCRLHRAQLPPDNWVYQGGGVTNWKDGGAHGAPGPIAGAGLPILAVGYGAYWSCSSLSGVSRQNSA